MSNQIATKELIKMLLYHENCVLKIHSDECLEGSYKVEKEYWDLDIRNEQPFTLFIYNDSGRLLSTMNNKTMKEIVEYIITGMGDYASFMFIEVVLNNVKQGMFAIENGLNKPSDKDTMEEIIDHTDNEFCNDLWELLEQNLIHQGVI